MKFILPAGLEPQDYLVLQIRNYGGLQHITRSNSSFACVTVTVQAKDAEAISDSIAKHFNVPLEVAFMEPQFGIDGYSRGHKSRSILRIYPPKDWSTNIDSDQFWNIVDATRRDTQEETSKSLEKYFKDKSHQECEDWIDILDVYIVQLDIDHFAELCLEFTGYNSDDHFESFRYGLIARGKTAYEMIIENPTIELLKQLFDNPKDSCYEMYGYEVRHKIWNDEDE